MSINAKGLLGDVKSGVTSHVKSQAAEVGLGKDSCPQPVKIDDPASEFWASPSTPSSSSRALPKDYAIASPQQKEFDPLNPPALEWQQKTWLRENSLRRPTIPGYPHVLTPEGSKMLSPRLERFQDNEPATLEPRLPRPRSPPDFSRYPEDLRAKALAKSSMKAYDGKHGGGLLKALKNEVADELVGGSTAEMKALMKVMKKEPDFMRRYMKGEIYQELYGNPSQPAAASSSSPSIASAASSSSLEPWHAPKPSQEFQEEYEGAWQRLWPQLNSELSRAGPLAQQTAESFRQILDTPKRRSLSPEGLMKGIENQIYKAESRNSVDKLSNFLIPVTSAQ
eukprot:TRINITY_DN22994_c0_g1_i1.p1 TRINITY_DN22994_c0_g1~~TRINITY_DN22994_c0_g1_i1.p1  ORF type:complete len:338 (+),score=81.89 TRINITY_DN22994_c0_g1_i1:298-1311(+)